MYLSFTVQRQLLLLNALQAVQALTETYLIHTWTIKKPKQNKTKSYKNRKNLLIKLVWPTSSLACTCIIFEFMSFSLCKCSLSTTSSIFSWQPFLSSTPCGFILSLKLLWKLWWALDQLKMQEVILMIQMIWTMIYVVMIIKIKKSLINMRLEILFMPYYNIVTAQTQL